MRLSDLVQASMRLTAERGRNAKVAIVAVALRLARVRRYRSDKPAADASTIDEVRALLPRDARA